MFWLTILRRAEELARTAIDDHRHATDASAASTALADDIVPSIEDVTAAVPPPAPSETNSDSSRSVISSSSEESDSDFSDDGGPQVDTMAGRDNAGLQYGDVIIDWNDIASRAYVCTMICWLTNTQIVAEHALDTLHGVTTPRSESFEVVADLHESRYRPADAMYPKDSILDSDALARMPPSTCDMLTGDDDVR